MAAVLLALLPSAVVAQTQRSDNRVARTTAVQPVRAAKSKAATKPKPPKEPAGYSEIVPGLERATAAAETQGPKPITAWPTGRKLIALTYDDGPNPTVTPELVALLKRKQVKATFYLLGESLAGQMRTAALLQDPLFEVGNHTYSHKQLTKLDDASVERELTRTEALITSATGRRARTMRPPYGANNQRVVEVCERLGYKVILWDVDTNDWRKRTVDQIVQTIVSGTEDGSIILMHDRLPTTVPATERAIDALRARGFEFVTVSELLSLPRASRAGTAARPAGAGAKAPSSAATNL
ncbi:MAG: polysaccharide deacetylase family protein [Candidatus Sumerlaeaceae bacterium]|nr:polysaccharide deacetylase family protein [Candidatus Sumerlaeaceae bacterium]